MSRDENARRWSACVGPAIVALALIGLVTATLITNAPILFPLDDAYITIANAELLLTGSQDGYGASRPTGATSLIHLLLLAGLHLLWEGPTANLLLATSAAALYAFGLYRLTLLLTGRRLLATLGALAGLMGGLNWFQLMNGLETGLAMAAVTWVAVWAQTPEDGRSQSCLALLIGVLPFLRPELGLLTLTMALAATIRLRKDLGRLARLAGLSLLAMAAMATLSWMATGDFMPKTLGAKVAYFAEDALPLGWKLKFALLWALSGPSLALLGLSFVLFLKDGWAMLLFGLLLILAMALSFPGALHHNEHRYLYPLTPFGIGGVAALTNRLTIFWPWARRAAALAALSWILAFPMKGWAFHRESMGYTKDQERLALWAERNLPSDSRILIHDAGYFAWRTDFRLVDVVGLKNPEVIALHQRFTRPSAGAERYKAVDAIARASDVSHAIILNTEFWGGIKTDLLSTGWRLEPLRAEADHFYHLYRLHAPEAGPSAHLSAP